VDLMLLFLEGERDIEPVFQGIASSRRARFEANLDAVLGRIVHVSVYTYHDPSRIIYSPSGYAPLSITTSPMTYFRGSMFVASGTRCASSIPSKNGSDLKKLSRLSNVDWI
jgi:hypothetical protein